VNYLIERH